MYDIDYGGPCLAKISPLAQLLSKVPLTWFWRRIFIVLLKFYFCTCHSCALHTTLTTLHFFNDFYTTTLLHNYYYDYHTTPTTG